MYLPTVEPSNTHTRAPQATPRHRTGAAGRKTKERVSRFPSATSARGIRRSRGRFRNLLLPFLLPLPALVWLTLHPLLLNLLLSSFCFSVSTLVASAINAFRKRIVEESRTSDAWYASNVDSPTGQPAPRAPRRHGQPLHHGPAAALAVVCPRGASLVPNPALLGADWYWTPCSSQASFHPLLRCRGGSRAATIRNGDRQCNNKEGARKDRGVLLLKRLWLWWWWFGLRAYGMCT